MKYEMIENSELDLEKGKQNKTDFKIKKPTTKNLKHC